MLDWRKFLNYYCDPGSSPWTCLHVNPQKERKGITCSFHWRKRTLCSVCITLHFHLGKTEINLPRLNSVEFGLRTSILGLSRTLFLPWISFFYRLYAAFFCVSRNLDALVGSSFVSAPRKRDICKNKIICYGCIRVCHRLFIYCYCWTCIAIYLSWA